MEYISDAQAKRIRAAVWQRTTGISPVKSEIMRSG